MSSKQTGKSSTLRNKRKVWWAWGLYRNWHILVFLWSTRLGDPRTYHLYLQNNTNKKQTKKQTNKTKLKKGRSSNYVFITVHTMEWPNKNIGMPVLSAVTWSMCLKAPLTWKKKSDVWALSPSLWPWPTNRKIYCQKLALEGLYHTISCLSLYSPGAHKIINWIPKIMVQFSTLTLSLPPSHP